MEDVQNLYHYNATLVGVIDGDTIDVNIDLGMKVWQHNVRLRITGIDAYESKNNSRAKLQAANLKIPVSEVVARGRQSKEWLTGQLGQCKFKVNTLELDSFGRWLSNIWIAGEGDTELALAPIMLQLKMAIPYAEAKT